MHTTHSYTTHIDTTHTTHIDTTHMFPVPLQSAGSLDSSRSFFGEQG